MSDLESLPPVIAIAAAILLVIGATLTLLGNIGLVRFRNFYQRLHAPTLGTSWGMAATVLASILVFGYIHGHRAIAAATISVFVMVTMPIAMLLLGRAALRRERPHLGQPPENPPASPPENPPAPPGTRT